MQKHKESIFFIVLYYWRVSRHKNTVWSQWLMSVFLFALSITALVPWSVSASSISAQKIIELTNRQRVIAGIPSLQENNTLAIAARDHAKDMARQGYFAHTNPQGKRFSWWIRKTGYAYGKVGENLAMDFVTSEGVLDGWIHSKAHRKNLLDPRYTEIGIAIVQTVIHEHATTLVVQIFGDPLAPQNASIKKTGVSATSLTEASTLAQTEPLVKTHTQSLYPFTPFPELHVVTMLAYLQHVILNPNEQQQSQPPTLPTAVVRNQEGFDKRRKLSTDTSS